MKPKAMVKIAVDLGMTLLLMLLMAFERIGRTAHEWLGMGMFALFVVHHILNRAWSKNLFSGTYSPYRIAQTALVVLVFASMLGSMVSALLISREVFAFLPIRGGRELGRTLHMLSAYWGFVWMSLHLGLHGSVMLGMAKKVCKRPSRAVTYLLRGAAVCIVAFGAYAFVKRGIPGYMFLQSQFVYFDFEEPLFYLFIDLLCAMGMLATLGLYGAQWLRKRHQRAPKRKAV